MKTDELREKYLDFFVSKGHRRCESDVLVPKWDPTVFFTPAGMNPFKDHFLGKVELEFTRATSCQKCLRTGDIENVGRTAYHHTFFEMLGNFSFGDYFKREAINWAWEFLTDKKWLGLDPDRLTVSVFLEDDEAADIWRSDIGLSPDRIARMDEYDNFWPAGAPSDGPDGVCGPCSEIFFHPEDGDECEIWNLVFTQFNRSGAPPDNLTPLPSKNIDTGMGLERMAAMLQGVDTNFHIDTLIRIVQSAAEVCGRRYDPASEDGRRLRRIADHVRACTMAIHENVYPGNEKEEYVVRRLLRRAVLQGHSMGLQQSFLHKIVPAVVDVMAVPYPDLLESTARVEKVIQNEEENFLAKIDEGLHRIEKIFDGMRRADATAVEGVSAFKVYSTFGFPPELFESMAADQGFGFDWDGFEDAKQQHARDSDTHQGGVMGDFGPIDDIKREVKSTEFVGYESNQSPAVIKGIVVEATHPADPTGGDGTAPGTSEISYARETSIGLPEPNQRQLLILDRTPFYGESGGQVGDTGDITSETGRFEVTDTQKNGDLYVHYGRLVSGELSVDQTVVAHVNLARRSGIRRAHTATHILHYALQQHLGTHAQQRGSKVEDDWLRFDFANMEPVSSEQLEQIESISNLRIGAGADVRAEILPLEEARSRGAMMLFGERYPDPVRMVSIGGFSRELCGGTHVENASEIQQLELVSEDNISAGTRRIQALTGVKAREYREQVEQSVDQLTRLLGRGPGEFCEAITDLQSHVKSLRKQLSAGKPGVPADPDDRPPVEAVPQSAAAAGYTEIRAALRQAAKHLNVSPFDVVDRTEGLISEIDSLTQELDQMAAVEVLDAEGLIDTGEQYADVLLIAQNMVGANPGLMRQLIDAIRKKLNGPVAVLLAAPQGTDKVALVAGVSRSLVDRGISAGDWVRTVAPVVGGGGGGKPDLAQAGGKKPEKIPEALNEAIDCIKSKIDES